MIFILPQILDCHASETPAALAVECLGDQLSYQQLLHSSNQLAHFMLGLGVEKGQRVGIYMDKSLHMAVAIYGILRIGGVYVPLDSAAPAERLAQIIDDCQISMLISGDSKKKGLSKLIQKLAQPLNIVGVTQQFDNSNIYSWSDIFDQYSTDTPSVKVIESDLAYIIYTSGSTGLPKGIMHTHHSCLSYCRWAAETYTIQVSDKMGNHAPLHFDISIFDWFVTGLVGACVVLIPMEYTKLPASYAQLIESSQITVLFTVPFALGQLSLRGGLESRNLSALRWIICAGEPFPVRHLTKLQQQLPLTQFDNMYGPAEVNGCTHYTVPPICESQTTIPIGNINEISECLVVDDSNTPVKMGEVGELLVRTPSMMQGYWGRADLNENVFFIYQNAKKYGSEFKHRYYRTGDLVKEDEQGDLWFLGRKDRQIKVRGYRVELDEIEAVFVSHPRVIEAAVIDIQSQNADVVEVFGYFICEDNQPVSTKDIRKYLKDRLPPYAVPVHIEQRSAFPRTTSDKINRTQLKKEASHASSKSI